VGEELVEVSGAHRHHVGHLLHARNGTVVDVSWLQLTTGQPGEEINAHRCHHRRGGCHA
jgi:hypothetical protein